MNFIKQIIILSSLLVSSAIFSMEDELAQIKQRLIAETKPENRKIAGTRVATIFENYDPSAIKPQPQAIVAQSSIEARKIVATYGFAHAGKLHFLESDTMAAKILASLNAKAQTAITLVNNTEAIAQADTVLTFFAPDGLIANVPVVAWQLQMAKNARNKIIINTRHAAHPQQAQEQLAALAVDSGIVQNKLLGISGHHAATFYFIYDASKKELFDVPSNTLQLEALAQELKK